MKNIVTIIVFVVCILSVKAQTVDTSIIKDPRERNYFIYGERNLNFLKMDKIGDYNISFFIIGEVELDSLIFVHYQYNVFEKIKRGLFPKTLATPVIGYMITFEKNIPLIASTPPERLHELLKQKDVFLLETKPWIIKYSVASQCSDTLRQRLYEMIPSGIALSWNSNIPCEQKEYFLLKDEKKRSIYYKKVIGTNKFLLLLMNRTWEESSRYIYSDPPEELDTTNTYIKYLIPLY